MVTVSIFDKLINDLICIVYKYVQTDFYREVKLEFEQKYVFYWSDYLQNYHKAPYGWASNGGYLASWRHLGHTNNYEYVYDMLTQRRSERGVVCGNWYYDVVKGCWSRHLKVKNQHYVLLPKRY